MNAIAKILAAALKSFAIVAAMGLLLVGAIALPLKAEPERSPQPKPVPSLFPESSAIEPSPFAMPVMSEPPRSSLQALDDAARANEDATRATHTFARYVSSPSNSSVPSSSQTGTDAPQN